MFLHNRLWAAPEECPQAQVKHNQIIEIAEVNEGEILDQVEWNNKVKYPKVGEQLQAEGNPLILKKPEDQLHQGR